MDLNELHEKLGSAEDTKDYLRLYSDLFKILSKKAKEDNGTFLSMNPLVSKALVDLNIQDAELQQRILLTLGLLLCKNNPVELPQTLKQQAMKDVVNLLMVTSDRSVTFRSFWCLSQFLDAGLKMEESMVLNIFNSIENVQSSCMRNVTLYGEACGLLQKIIEKNTDGLFKHVQSLTKLVFTPVFHPVSKIREISYKTLQLVAPTLQYGNENGTSPVGAVILDLIKKMLDDMRHLFRNKNEVFVLEVWKIVVNILGQSLHKNVNAINGLLTVVEKGFKHESQDVKLKSFDAWKTLISNFALSEDVICIPKKLRLLLQPLLRISATKTEAVIQAKCDTWWHIVWSLGEKIPNHFELVCLPFLEFVFGTSFKDNGEIAVLQQSTVYSSSQQRMMKHKGCEILIRFLEQPPSSSFHQSPKKTPPLSIPPLKKPVSSVIFLKFPKEFVKATGVVIKEFGKDVEMLGHTDYLLKLVLFAISNTPHDASKDCIDAIASFVQLIVDIVKSQLCPPSVCSKLVDKVCQLPKKMLTAHYYYVGSTGVMHGNLYLTILSLLLHPTFLTMPDFKNRIVPLFQKLAGSSIKSSLSPLSYAHSIILFMKEQTVINNCDAEVLLNLWSAVSSALFAAVQETLEISGSTCFEQDFSCMYDVLTYPFEYILILNTSQGQFKAILTKSWGDLYKLFYRCSALLPSTDNNSACDGICSQLLKCLNKDNVENSSICEVLSHILPIIVECVDFEAVGKNSGKGGFSAERWTKGKQNQLGNIAPLIDVIKWFLIHFHETMSVELSGKDKDAQQSTIKFAVMYLEILNTFISKITSSKALSAVLDQLAEPLSKVYEYSRKKNIGTKKNVHAFLTQLEILWKTVTTNIQVHYTAQYDSDFLQVLSPLLEVNLQHHRQEIKDRSRQFWFASFAPNQSKLEYPSSLKEVLKKLRPPLLPESDISPIEEDSPLTDFSEDQSVLIPPPKEESVPLVMKLPPCVSSSPSHNTRKINENSSPSVKKTPSKGKPDKISIDDLPKDEFIEIKLPPPSRMILTRRQKEAMKKKSYVPALYSELSQNSCSMDYLADTQEDSCSVISVSQDEHEISVLGEFPSSVKVKEKQIQESGLEDPTSIPSAKGLQKQEVASSSANDHSEKPKSGDIPGELHVTEPLKPVSGSLDQTTELPNGPLNSSGTSPGVEVMAIEVIDVDSQSESEDITPEQVNMEKETSVILCGSEGNNEATNLTSVDKSDPEARVIIEGSDVQNCSLQQENNDALRESKNERENPKCCDDNSLNSCSLPENEQSKDVESASSLLEGGESEDLDAMMDSEEIIPSSQSSSEGDHDIPKDSSLVYRFKSTQKTPTSVLSPAVPCGKLVSNSKSLGDADTVLSTGKGVSRDKLNGLPIAISVDSAMECTGVSEKSDVILDSKESRRLSDTLSVKETAVRENLPSENDGGSIRSAETKIKEPVATSNSGSEICDKNVNVPDYLSKENVKKKLCMESGSDVGKHNDISVPCGEGKTNTVNGHCSDSLAVGKKNVKVDKTTEKTASPKKGANKNSSSDNITKSKSSQNSPIIISVGSEPFYIKTRRQVIQHSPLLTRSKLKSSNVRSNVFSVNSSALKKGSKKGVCIRSPKKNAESSVTQNSLCKSLKLLPEHSVSISVVSAMGDHEYHRPAVEEPEECRIKEEMQDVNSTGECETLDNSDAKISEEMQSDLEVKLVSDICVGVENDANHMKANVIANEAENVNEVKGSIENVSADTTLVCEPSESPIISTGVSEAKESKLKETNNLHDCNTTCEKSLTQVSHGDESGDPDVEKNLVSSNLAGGDDNFVDETQPSELSKSLPEVLKSVNKPHEHSTAVSDSHTIIHETQNLIPDEETLPHNCEKPRENEQDLICSEKSGVKCVLEQDAELSGDGDNVDETVVTISKTIPPPVSDEFENGHTVSEVTNVKSGERSVHLSPTCVTISNETVQNEISPGCSKSINIPEDTRNSTEINTVYYEQIHHCDSDADGNHKADALHEPSSKAVCLDTKVQSDKNCTEQEKSTIECENSHSGSQPTAQNDTNNSLPSQNETIGDSLTQNSNSAVVEVGNFPSAERTASADKETPTVCSEMILQKDSHERTAVSPSSENDLNKEKMGSEGNTLHNEVSLYESTSDNSETAKNNQTSDSVQDDTLQRPLELNNIRRMGSPSKKTANQFVSAVSAASISPQNDVKPNVSSISSLVSNHNCDNGLSLSPCSGAKKRKQKIPSNSCLAMDMKRKKLELRSKKDASEKSSSPKQATCDSFFEKILTTMKPADAGETSLAERLAPFIEPRERLKPNPDKFMQLWHSSIVMNSDASVTVQEKKQKLPPEKIKNSSPNSKGNHSGSEADKTVVEDIKTEETSSSSVLRDVRNSPLQWRSTSSSVISIPVSPLSRSQRMVRAARKHMNSPDTAKQTGYSRTPRTTLLESPSTSKTSPSMSENSKVSSPAYSSILKKRTHDSSSTPSPPLKKRKVSFADPLVQGEMIIESRDNENSCRARRSAKRCLQMNRDNSQRNKRKFFWCNQEQEKEKSPNFKKAQQFLINEAVNRLMENSATASQNEHNQEKLEVRVIKKETDDGVAEDKIDETESEQTNVILEKENESTCPPPVAFTSQLSPTSSPTSSDIPSTDTYENSEDFNCNSQGIVFEELVDCSDPVNSIIPLLTSPMWVCGLSQLLLSRKINTIGDLSGLTVEKLKELPIKSPKLETVQNILKDYALQRLRSSSCKLNTASPSSPKSCDSPGEKTDVFQTSSDTQEVNPTVLEDDKPANPAERGENTENVRETDSSAMQVEPCEISEIACEAESQGQLSEEHDKEKCRELMEKLCNSQVIQEMPLVLLCDLLMKVTSGIKAKSCQKPQDKEN